MNRAPQGKPHSTGQAVLFFVDVFTFEIKKVAAFDSM
jgi:hypothetical protein